MKRLAFAAVFTIVHLAAPARGAEMKAHRDFAAKVEMLKSQFRPYDHGALKSIYFEPEGLRFWLEPTTKDQKRTELYSAFTLVGDFEVSVAYEWRTVTVPKEGYGLSCGIGVEVEPEKKMVFLARGFQIGTGDAYLRTKKVPGKDYDTLPYATTATKGRLVLRRQKAVVICLRADGDADPEELERVPFTTASVNKVHLFADPGGVPNALDARLTDIQVRAEEIPSDIPLRERESNLVWWLTVGFLIFAAAAGYLGYRRWQDDKWLWSRG